MNKKYLIWAIILSVMTIVYYAWMIPAWVNLNNVKSKSINNNASRPVFGYKVKEDANSNVIDASTFRWEDVEGEAPPTYAYYIKRPVYRCDSVLKVNTSGDSSYVIKVVDPYDDEVIMMCYLPAGISQEIDIPSGKFEIRYTSGTEWFGDVEMFGAKGSYAKADRLFNFSEGSGYELTLYRVPNGNLHTSRIKREDF